MFISRWFCQVTFKWRQFFPQLFTLILFQTCMKQKRRNWTTFGFIDFHCMDAKLLRNFSKHPLLQVFNKVNNSFPNIPNLCDFFHGTQKQRHNETESPSPHPLPLYRKSCNESEWWPSLSVHNNLPFVFHRRKKVTRVYNNTRVSKW